MIRLDARQQWLILTTLALLMAVTRSHHFATLNFLPDASWAAFFAAGFYARSVLALPLLLTVAALADAVAIGVVGVSGFCVSWSYPLLIPAYAALWWGGRWFSRRAALSWCSLALLGGAAAVAAFVAELIASGSFYVLSGVVADPSWLGFGQTLVRYFPLSFLNFSLYLGLIAGLHGVLAILRQPAPGKAPNA